MDIVILVFCYSAYAIAGSVDIDFEVEPLGHVNGQDVFLRDIWPTRAQIQVII